MNLVLIVFAYLCCRSMPRATVPLNFNAFLEKAKLKDMMAATTLTGSVT